MAPKFTGDDVRRIATLAHLQLSDAEVDAFTPQLARVLEYADAIAAVDTTGVEPLATLHDQGLAWRDDAIGPTLDRDTLLQNAPGADREAGLVRVPKVL
jgi:aspartyl-tRNA(Asn)/glutamyl-tRNA(Gln) amidotransferase subunit C